ncbi:MAG: hypothetical protein VKL59_22775 [Nostocaceae cyanobacterium]|nr:hypothetical protein [Nostocaceae cyanobacterium]
MVQQLRTGEAQYICVVPIDSITGIQDEEITVFAVSAEQAKNAAEKLLANNYGCNTNEISELMQQASIEPIAQWCSPSKLQG